MGNICAFNLGHDSSVAFYNEKTKKIHSIEMERLVGIKHLRMHLRSYEKTKEVLDKCFEIAEKEWGLTRHYEHVILGTDRTTPCRDYYKLSESDKTICANPELLKELITYDSYSLQERHHEGHAWCAAYQAPFDRGIIVTIDGVGNDGTTNLWVYENNKMRALTKPFEIRERWGALYYRSAYMGCPEIGVKTPIHLDICGKLMGFASYGRHDTHGFFLGKKLFSHDHETIKLLCPAYLKYEELYNKEKYKIIETLSDTPECFNPWEMMGPTQLSWQQQADIALGIHSRFEGKVIGFFRKYKNLFAEYDNNVAYGGGVSLNVVTNDALQKDLGITIHVPPNPADGGLSQGFILTWLSKNERLPPKHPQQYYGPKILDRDDFKSYIKKYDGKKTDLKTIAQYLKDDKIFGFVQGAIESGPRALGNRSILADPKGDHKKDQVNLVKRREPYRPFAPVCRHEDAEKYFDAYSYDNLSWMNFSTKVRYEYLDHLRAITHVDGTARLQTVKREQNEVLYDLLTEFDGVLLNTSFNLGGKPILNTYEEAFKMWNDEPHLDCLAIVDDDENIWLFEK